MGLDDMRAEIEARIQGGQDDVDVIITTLGGRETARAVSAGGGLVGLRSSATRPEDVEIDFIDWPFALDDPSLDNHIEMVREVKPKYAVAPDVEKGRTLDEVVEVAETLNRYAQNVLIVPKDVPVREVPEGFVVGLPFRDEWETDTGVNEFSDFRGREVHILGGNATEHFKLADRFKLDVTSVDSPNPLAWADGGRVWVARLGGANEVDDLIIQFIADRAPDPDRVWTEFKAMDYEDMDADEFMREVRARIGEDAGFIHPEATAALDLPTMTRLLRSRFARIQFSVINLRQAWNEERQVTTVKPVAPGRGPPPPAPEGLEEDVLEMAPGEFMTREERMERWLRTAQEETIGEVERSERGLATFTDTESSVGNRRTIVLVGCGKAKQSGVQQAQDLYTSTYFQLKRGYAESVGDEWYILSAEKGVIDPRELVACYDTNISEVNSQQWGRRVLEELPDLRGAEVIVLAGPDYLSPIEAGLRDRAVRVTTPTGGLEIHERLAWLSENTPAEG